MKATLKVSPMNPPMAVAENAVHLSERALRARYTAGAHVISYRGAGKGIDRIVPTAMRAEKTDTTASFTDACTEAALI